MQTIVSHIGTMNAQVEWKCSVDMFHIKDCRLTFDVEVNGIKSIEFD